MTLADRLRSIVEPLPDGSAVTLPADVLRTWLADEGALDAAESPRTATEPVIDLTVAEIAGRFGRGQSTVRTWLAAGAFPNAYRMRGSREWRVPVADIESMQRAEQAAHRSKQQRAAPSSKAEPPADLSSWRQHVRN